MTEFAEVLREKNPAEITIPVAISQELLVEMGQARAALVSAETVGAVGGSVDVEAARARLEAATAAAKVSSVQMRFRALPGREYRQLKKTHTPDGEKEWDDETFVPALISACALDPAISLEEAKQIWDEWSEAESARIFLACWGLNEEVKTLPFGDRPSGTTPG